eukprot:NODE_4753_length_1851_cov_21.885731.p1 GENE.NODE_4753_length_1851_cov_21.885731~~NODE_4753_length_1851_cov_21.885731.p1  ORF type:complete len:529 (-),score=176.20 NODE_4753_length_1851_cov_21.885731:161-1747(-)
MAAPAERQDGPIKCTWHLGTEAASPHVLMPPAPWRHKIMDSVLDNIGRTPMVRINKIGREVLKCELLAKCEFFNAGGSVKDRIGKRMIEEAERTGRIKPGDVLIEPTSGNTGIGLALAAAIKGYRMIITLPEKMSKEKVDVLKGLGAEIIRTPTEAAFDSPESHIGVALRLNQEIPNSHILDQYVNPANPLAHYDGTAEEILEQCEGRLDMIVIGAGTGGTLTGIARKLKEKLPGIIVVAVDPKGSILAVPDSLNDERRLQSYLIEGIGYDFIPTVLDRQIADEWIKTGDQEAFIMARRLIREEGLLCGGSSGTAMVAAVQAAQRLGEGKRCVVILPDSTRNYMTKFLADEWMEKCGFMPANDPELQVWWADRRVTDLTLPTPCTAGPNVTCREATDVLSDQGFDVLPIVDESGSILGVVTEGDLTAKITAGRLLPTSPVSEGLLKEFSAVGLGTTLAELSRIFNRTHFALVTTEHHCIKSGKEMQKNTFIASIVTRIDLLHFIVSREPIGRTPSASSLATMSLPAVA